MQIVPDADASTFEGLHDDCLRGGEGRGFWSFKDSAPGPCDPCLGTGVLGRPGGGLPLSREAHLPCGKDRCAGPGGRYEDAYPRAHYELVPGAVAVVAPASSRVPHRAYVAGADGVVEVSFIEAGDQLDPAGANRRAWHRRVRAAGLMATPRRHRMMPGHGYEVDVVYDWHGQEYVALVTRSTACTYGPAPSRIPRPKPSAWRDVSRAARVVCMPARHYREVSTEGTMKGFFAAVGRMLAAMGAHHAGADHRGRPPRLAGCPQRLRPARSHRRGRGDGRGGSRGAHPAPVPPSPAEQWGRAALAHLMGDEPEAAAIDDAARAYLDGMTFAQQFALSKHDNVVIGRHLLGERHLDSLPRR